MAEHPVLRGNGILNREGWTADEQVFVMRYKGLGPNAEDVVISKYWSEQSLQQAFNKQPEGRDLNGDMVELVNTLVDAGLLSGHRKEEEEEEARGRGVGTPVVEEEEEEEEEAPAYTKELMEIFARAAKNGDRVKVEWEPRR